MGIYGEIPYPLSDLNEICSRVRLKPSNDRGEFELDRARSKNNISENSFALGHETDNNFSQIKRISRIRTSSKKQNSTVFGLKPEFSIYSCFTVKVHLIN